MFSFYRNSSTSSSTTTTTTTITNTKTKSNTPKDHTKRSKSLTPRGITKNVSSSTTQGEKSDMILKQSHQVDIGFHGAATHWVIGDSRHEGNQDEGIDPVVDFERLRPEPVKLVRSADELLSHGIGDYTFVPSTEGGVIGKGKFSTVFKVKGMKGETYALKHTPLYPHHPLISARLLREPTLLAQLPPHPNLIPVLSSLKTPSHIYLVEHFPPGHRSLTDLVRGGEMVGDFRAVRKVMRQLVRVVRDGLHRGGRVCHRDLKTDNLLIDENGHILLLDLGLATHFSLSQPRLTTCCGSPAFHSPELIDALQNPPGSRTYYGPELDIWCIGLCILSLITGRKYPIGTDHKEWKVMERGVKECLDHAEEVVERRSFDLTGQDLGMEEWNEWVEFKGVVQGFMLIDGDERMRVFDLIDVGREEVDEVPLRGRKEFKTILFEKSKIKHPLPLFLRDPTVVSGSKLGEDTKLYMDNPEEFGLGKVVSFLKYLLRTDGILYHCVSISSTTCIIQCVLDLPSSSPLVRPPSSMNENTAIDTWSLTGLFARRAVSVPPKVRGQEKGGKEVLSATGKGKKWAVRFWMKVEFKREEREGEVVHTDGVTGLGLEGGLATKPQEGPEKGEMQGLGLGRPRIARLQTEPSTISRRSGSRNLSLNPPGQTLAARRKQNDLDSPLLPPSPRFLNDQATLPADSPTCSHLGLDPSPPCSPGVPGGVVEITLSDPKVREIVAAALSSERWKGLDYTGLTRSRASSRESSVAGFGRRRMVSGETMASPLCTPHREIDEDEALGLGDVRGRREDLQSGTGDERRSRSLRSRSQREQQQEEDLERIVAQKLLDRGRGRVSSVSPATRARCGGIITT